MERQRKHPSRLRVLKGGVAFWEWKLGHGGRPPNRREEV
jgi:hypothetical protein